MPAYYYNGTGGGWVGVYQTTATNGSAAVQTYWAQTTSTTMTATTASSSMYYQQAQNAYYNYALAQQVNYARAYPVGQSPWEQREKLMAHKDEAKKRAEELLLAHLTPKQRKQFKDNGWFVVKGGKSKQEYRIRKGDDLIANIDVLGKTGVKHRLCGHCDPEKVPLHDHLLAQKIMLEIAEDDFLRIANRHAA